MRNLKKIAVLLLASMSYLSLSAAEVEFNGALTNDYIGEA